MLLLFVNLLISLFRLVNARIGVSLGMIQPVFTKRSQSISRLENKFSLVRANHYFPHHRTSSLNNDIKTNGVVLFLFPPNCFVRRSRAKCMFSQYSQCFENLFFVLTTTHSTLILFNTSLNIALISHQIMKFFSIIETVNYLPIESVFFVSLAVSASEASHDKFLLLIKKMITAKLYQSVS